MAQALLKGLLERGWDVASLRVADPSAAALARVAALAPIATSARAADAVSDASVVVLAVKPQFAKAALADIRGTLRDGAVVLSLAAGVTLARLAAGLDPGRAIVRSMPNTPAQVGAGATALFANADANAQQRDAAEEVLAAVGITVWVGEERLLDAVTALSGSGPAYFMLLIEALREAGEALGLDAEITERLVTQTALGSARLVESSALDCAALRRQVTSPGGTTERAVQVFEQGDLRGLARRAVQAAALRAAELAEPD